MDRLSSSFADSCAFELGCKRRLLDLPWESGPLRDVLGTSGGGIIPPPRWVHEAMPAKPASRDVAIPDPVTSSSRWARQKLASVDWLQTEQRDLDVALQCWRVIITESGEATSLGKTLIEMASDGSTSEDITQCLRDVFAHKASSTMKIRAASLIAYARWKQSGASEMREGIFPISEQQVYAYLCELRQLKASASKRSRFFEALGFAKGMIGAHTDHVLQSSRVRGVALGGDKPLPSKKVPLEVQQVIVLEQLAAFSRGPTAIFAGYLCFIIHCRLRWNDGMHCIREPNLDLTGCRGFVEAELYHHKTARKRRTLSTRLLPVAGVFRGVSGHLWAVQWLKMRKEEGLKASKDQPLMPAPLLHGGWSNVPLRSSEASVWMREILSGHFPHVGRELATHSCKQTVLSWLAKANVNIGLRRLAGYHVKPGDRSALEYSRDAAAPVLRQIDCVFLSIRSGMFNPDGPRSDRWIECSGLREAVRMASSVASRVVHPGTLSVRVSHGSAGLKEAEGVADIGGCNSDVSSASSSSSCDTSSDEDGQEREAALGAQGGRKRSLRWRRP